MPNHTPSCSFPEGGDYIWVLTKTTLYALAGLFKMDLEVGLYGLNIREVRSSLPKSWEVVYAEFEKDVRNIQLRWYEQEHRRHTKK